MIIFEKPHWIIWISLLCYYVKVKAEWLSDEKRDRVLKKFNDRRDNMAYELRIANMWKLEWDEKLAVKARALEAERAKTDSYEHYIELKNEANSRVFVTFLKGDDNSTTALKAYDVDEFFYLRWHSDEDEFKDMVESLNDNWNSGTNQIDGIKIQKSSVEALLPTQRLIGCSTYRASVRIQNKWITYYILCLVGPHGYPSMKKIEWGEPGSRCGEHGIKSESNDFTHVCVPDPQNPFPTEAPPTTTPKNKKKKTGRQSEDDDNDDDEESSKRKKNKDEEYDLILDFNSVRMDKGTFAVLVFVLIVAF